MNNVGNILNFTLQNTQTHIYTLSHTHTRIPLYKPIVVILRLRDIINAKTNALELNPGLTRTVVGLTDCNLYGYQYKYACKNDEYLFHVYRFV